MGKKVDLSSLTFEGRKLDEVLKEQEDKKKVSAIEYERQQEQSRGMQLYGIKWGRAVKSPRGRSSKARLWSDHKIRREYGLMKKPYGNQWQNLLWLIAFKPPVTAKSATETLDADSTSTISAALSSIQEYLGDNNAYGASLVYRGSVSGRYHYTPMAFQHLPEGTSITDEDRKDWFDRACEQYKAARLIHSRQQAAARKAKKEGKEIDPKHKKEFVHFPETPPEPQATPEAIADQRDQDWNEKLKEAQDNVYKATENVTDKLRIVIRNMINETLEREGLDTSGKRLDLNINVTGKIKFRFGLGD